MKWRTRLAILFGVLLPLPLIWASSKLLLLGGLKASVTHTEDSRWVPILPPDETRRLLTFERDCASDEDCEVPLVCLRQWTWKRACVASTCATDTDCSQGLSCHSVAAGGRVLRRCGAPGDQPEGAFCVELPQERSMGCAPDLVCTHMKCRRPCQPREARSCPDGYSCHAADVKGSVCLPTCEGRSCPEGQRCVDLGRGVSSCARVHGVDCQLNPCPADQVCEISEGKARGDVWMKCALSCGKQGPSCPEGFLCGGGQCRQQCTSDVPGACGPMEKCAVFSEREPGVCIFDSDK